MNFFPEIHKVFMNVISSKVTIIQCMLFLFHYEYHKQSCIDSDNNAYENYFYRIYNGNIQKSNKLWKYFNYELEWEFDSFTQYYGVSYSDIQKQLNKELAALLDNFIGIKSEELSNQVLLELLMYLQSQQASKKIIYPFIKYKYQPCRFYRRRNYDEEAIIQKLKKDHVVFLYGLPGIGKTELIKYIFQNCNEYDYQDVFIVSYTASLEHTLSKIEYETISHKMPRFMNNRSEVLLKLKDCRSLLIIDDMDCDSLTIQKNYDILKQLSVDIIVVNNTSSIPSDLPQHYLKAMSKNELQMLLKQHYSGNTDCFDYIYDYFQGHTLSIVLIGKLLSKNKMTLCSFKNSLKNTAFKDITFTNDNIKHNGDRRKLLNHLDLIFDFDLLLNKSEKDMASNLALFKGVCLPISALPYWIPKYSQQVITTLVQKGIVTINNDYIQMHSLISELLFNRKKSAKKLSGYLDILNRISPDVEKLNQSYKNGDVQEILYAIFICLNPEIKFATNKNQSTFSRSSQIWWDFCQKSIEYFLDFENTVYANIVLREIYIPKSGIAPYIFQNVEKTFLQQYIDWINDSFCCQPVSKVLDELIDLCNKNDLAYSNLPHIYQTLCVNLCRLLDKTLITMRENKCDTELANYYSEILECLQKTTANIEYKDESYNSSWRFIISYYHTWHCIFAHTQSYKTSIKYMDSLYSIVTDPCDQIRLLSDIIYVSLVFYPLYPDRDKLRDYHVKLTELLKNTTNVPTNVYCLSMMSNIYYAITFLDKELLIEYLSSIPETTQKVLRIADSNYPTALNEVVHNTIKMLHTLK